MNTRASLHLLAVAALLAAAGCSRPGGPEGFLNAGPPDAGSAGAARCDMARTAEPLPARSNLISADGSGGGPTTMFTRDLFGLFRSYCGACHVETSLGDFNVTQVSFPAVDVSKVLERLTADDPDKFMPPLASGGKPYSTRPATDAVVQFVGLLTTWNQQGKPKDVFRLAAQGDSGPKYTMSDWSIDHMTRLGDCVPTKAMVGVFESRMDDRDTFFAAATALPENLADTDVDTLDSASLAQEGVIAFAPTYPLWTDGAGKLRFVRVPRGTSIEFDAATQSFKIPPNTRFYKTFLEKVIDAKGFTSWRKLETRLIVSRPDLMNPDGTAEPQALYGTYIWNDDESEAHLLQDPLRDGTPFRDRLISVVVDEPTASDIQAQDPSDLVYELEEAHTGVVRHYAIPGSERCVQCHMGSTSSSFVLGFNPLQLNRRAGTDGGVYETAGPDDLTQLQRFIDYGLITGMKSPDEVTPLERSQGERKPRNDLELKAQAYMVGNCGHCHNPRGYPTIKNPELKDALNFFPTATDGGIFQFPLERTSPLRRRGASVDIAMPYITPSLREYPVGPSSTATWAQKWFPCPMDTIYDRTDQGLLPYYPLCYVGKTNGHIPAPWRSLLYRNVDTPFTYADDFVIYPHMPMNSLGYDCRVPRIMGDWMVSIPAKRVSTIDEDAVPPAQADTSVQPYVEVKPGDPDYDYYVSQSQSRLAFYRAGPRYGFCPDQSDTVDHAVLNRKRGDPLVPVADSVFDTVELDKLVQLNVGVPAKAHWVITDLTEVPGDWYPRRPDWAHVLVDQVLDDDPDLKANPNLLQEQTDLVKLLQDVRLTSEVRSFATTDVPFGLWVEKPGCDLSHQKKATDFQGDARPAWMDVASPAATAPVYMLSPGATVFTTVCFNCHGIKADAKGILADAIQTMTGGEAHVADLRDGLLGPVSSPGTDIDRVFGPSASASVATKDWAARYMAWMTLGGTKRELPQDLLNIVAATTVLGVPRGGVQTTGSANMLKLGKELCYQLVGGGGKHASYDISNVFTTGHLAWSDETALIDTNGDAEMWLRLCSLNNQMVVRVASSTDWTNTPPRLFPLASLYYADAYPASAPVLDHRGRVAHGVTPDNLYPLCIRKPDDAAQVAAADAVLAAKKVFVPYCPAELFAENDRWRLPFVPDPNNPGQFVLTGANKWATRGAINAALSVFLYLDSIENGVVTPKPAYNRCDQL